MTVLNKLKISRLTIQVTVYKTDINIKKIKTSIIFRAYFIAIVKVNKLV